MSRGIGRVQIAAIDFLIVNARHDRWATTATVAADVFPNYDARDRSQYESTRRALIRLHQTGMVESRIGERRQVEYRLTKRAKEVPTATS